MQAGRTTAKPPNKEENNLSFNSAGSKKKAAIPQKAIANSMKNT
jgi:hypothetical protein